jgi:hypothetical protein
MFSSFSAPSISQVLFSSTRHAQEVDQVPPLFLLKDLFHSRHRIRALAEDREKVAVRPILEGVGLGEVG